MVDMYVKLVLAGKRTCDEMNKEIKQVPVTCHAEVLAVLTEMGYDANGKKLA